MAFETPVVAVAVRRLWVEEMRSLIVVAATAFLWL